MKNNTRSFLSFILAALFVFAPFTVFAENESVSSDVSEEFADNFECQIGDVNYDGKITAADARLALRCSASLLVLSERELRIADYNSDSKITAADARLILRVSAKLGDMPPFGEENSTADDGETTTNAPQTTTDAPETTTAAPQTTAPPETTTKQPETTTNPPASSNDGRTFTVETSPLFSVKNAGYAALYDYDNDKILYGKNMHAHCYPASTTKILTACLASEYLDADYILNVGDELSLVNVNSSLAGIYSGQKIRFKEILKCLLAPSGCDAAYTIAVNTARVASGDSDMKASKALSYFVDMMNDYAKQLGMNDSHFANPDGYPNADHYSSACDMIIIAAKACSVSLIMDIASKPYVTAYFYSGGQATYYNTNETIDPNSSHYYPYMEGLKTGYHSKAGQCLVAVAKKNIDETGETRTFIAAVYKCPNKDARYEDITGLFNTAFMNFC